MAGGDSICTYAHEEQQIADNFQKLRAQAHRRLLAQKLRSGQILRRGQTLRLPLAKLCPKYQGVF